MRRLLLALGYGFLLMHSQLSAQASAPSPPPPQPRVQSGRTQKSASAARVAAGAIRLDGHLDDAAWARVPALTDFVQKDPIEGAAPTDQLEIRIAYDDEALYVGTRVRAKDPSAIQAPVSRRDNIHQAEHILISLDTYRDRRTAYSFADAGADSASCHARAHCTCVHMEPTAPRR